MSRVMKNSGVDWLGQIPAHWNLKRAKFVFKQSSSKGNSRLVLLSATQDRGVVDKSTLEGVVQVAESADLNTFKTVHINDFVISLRSFQGGFEISHCEGVISPAYTVFRLREGDYVEYYKHLFKSIGFIDKINSLTVGIREGKNIQYEDFSNMIIPVLPISEQQTIADFLDKKCGEIDEMVSLQEKIVEELKAYKQSVITQAVCKGLNPEVPMKDSGIEWIGQIPNHWGTNLIGTLFCEHKQKNEGLLEKNLLSLSYGKVIRKDIDSVGGLLPMSYEGYNIIDKNDIVLRMTDLQNDKKSLRTGLCQERGIITSAYITLRPRVRLKSDYYHYLLHSYDVCKVFYGMGGGVRQGINYDDIKKILLVIPPVDEQQAIVDYLDNKCSEIDALISLKQYKIDALKEYKKSIIYEYITGKKEIPYGK